MATRRRSAAPAPPGEAAEKGRSGKVAATKDGAEQETRTVRNRGFARFIHTVRRGEKTVLYGFPTGIGAAP